MKCPTCNVTIIMADRSGIEIDYCPDCLEIWLDQGKFDKIIVRSTQQPSTNMQSRYPEE